MLTEGKLRICFAVLFDLTDWAIDRTDLSFDLTRLADLIGLLELLGASSSLSPTLHKTMTGQQRGGRACQRGKKNERRGESVWDTLNLPSPIPSKLGEVVGIVDCLCKPLFSSVKEATIVFHNHTQRKDLMQMRKSVKEKFREQKSEPTVSVLRQWWSSPEQHTPRFPEFPCRH